MSAKGRRVMITKGVSIIPFTWNPSDKDNNAVLSNGNLTLQTDSNNVYASARGTVALPQGKYIYQSNIRNDSNGTTGFGFGAAAASLGNKVGGDVNGFGFLGVSGGMTFNLWNNNAAVAGPFTNTGEPDPGSILVALDSVSGKIWIGNATDGWNGDPAAGTGEAWSSALLQTTLYPMATCYKNRLVSGDLDIVTIETPELVADGFSILIPG